MEKCEFCKLYKSGKLVPFYESNFFFSIFDSYPVSIGHSLIIPKRHIVSFFELNEKEWNNLQKCIKQTKNYIVEKKKNDWLKIYEKGNKNNNEKSEKFYKNVRERIKKYGDVDVDGKIGSFNIGVNEGKEAGRTINHLHIHLIPRFEGDVEDCIGGVRNVIPGMGNYK